jgi:DNA repair protein RadD
MTAISLRDYQDASISGLRSNIKAGVKNQILLAPTGAGKTVLGAYLLNEAHGKMRRAVFVCDRISLVNQTSATLDHYGIPHGVLQAQHWRYKPWERIQVASAATLARRGWPEVDLVLVDECHSLVKNTIERISKRDVITIGLTATPFSKGLGKHYDAMVGVTTTNQLIKQKFLVPFRVFAASEPDMTGAKVVAGEWSESEAADRAMPIIGDCVIEYLKHGANKKFIAFGCNVAHATEMKKQFADAGVICELYTYREGDEFRTEVVDEFRKPDSYIRGLISVSALSKGFDVSDVEVIIMARPLKSSLAEHIQILGRGLRIHDGKESCLILDHAGNCMRFWDAMSEFFETGRVELDDGKPKKAVKKKPKDRHATKCPVCHHIHECAICPSCGHTAERKSGVTHVAGTLKEMLRDGDKSTLTQRLWPQLCAYAIGLNGDDLARAEKRALGMFKGMTGDWPSNASFSKTTPVNPTRETLNLIRRNQIAYSKRAK